MSTHRSLLLSLKRLCTIFPNVDLCVCVVFLQEWHICRFERRQICTNATAKTTQKHPSTLCVYLYPEMRREGAIAEAMSLLRRPHVRTSAGGRLLIGAGECEVGLRLYLFSPLASPQCFFFVSILRTFRLNDSHLQVSAVLNASWILHSMMKISFLHRRELQEVAVIQKKWSNAVIRSDDVRSLTLTLTDWKHTAKGFIPFQVSPQSRAEKTWRNRRWAKYHSCRIVNIWHIFDNVFVWFFVHIDLCRLEKK